MKQKTLHILLACKEPSSFAAFSQVLSEDSRLKISQASSAERSLQTMRKRSIDVAVVADELQDKSGLQFVREIVADNPFINCALASPLYPQEFHEQTEGLGVFMQLAVDPDAEAARQMLILLENLNQLRKPIQKDRKQQ